MILITTVSSGLLTYNFPANFSVTNPIKYTFFKPIIDNIFIICIPSAIFLAIITVVEILNRKTIENLEKKNKEYELLSETISENLKELFNGFLYRFAISQANFTTNERITLYIHNGENSFIPFGRYSQNTKYSKAGRASYPDNEGCIAKGWEKKWYFDNAFPTDDKEYLNTTKQKYLIDTKIVSKIKMKSKLFAVLRLDNKSKSIGLIVVEWIDGNKYSEKMIKKILENQQQYLSEMICSLEKYIPKPSNAKGLEE